MNRIVSIVVLEDIIRKGYNWRLLYLEDGTLIKVKVKRYKCKKCRRKFQVEFTECWSKFCNYSNKVKTKAKKKTVTAWVEIIKKLRK